MPRPHARLMRGLSTALCAGALAVLPAVVHAQSLGTLAGDGTTGSAGDGGLALVSQLNGPSGIAVAPDGAILVVEQSGNRVRRIGPEGIITRIAGTGVAGSTGDGGPAIDAQLNGPTGIAVAPDGTIFVTELTGLRVRRIAPDGTISTFAGTGVAGSTGDGGDATAATLTQPASVAVLADGSVLIADAGARRVRRVVGGTILAFAGSGAPAGIGDIGDGGPATAAGITTPFGLAQRADGSVLISDYGNNRVRVVSPVGTISTLVGIGISSGAGDGALAPAVPIAGPSGIAVAPDGSVLIAEFDGGRVRRVAPNGRVSTIAGGGASPFVAGLPAVGSFVNGPAAVAALADGGVIFSSTTNVRLHHIDTRLAAPGDGPAGPLGPVGLTGPVGPQGPAGQDRTVLAAALAAPRLTGTARRTLGVRLVLTTRAVVTLELLRAGRRAARVQRTLAPGRRTMTLRLPARAGAYRLHLTARSADGQRVTDRVSVAVRAAARMTPRAR